MQYFIFKFNAGDLHGKLDELLTILHKVGCSNIFSFVLFYRVMETESNY